jgi:hypothetical protein
MSLTRRRAFFRARAGCSDANAQAIIDGLRALGHFVIPVRASEPGVSDLCVYQRQQWIRMNYRVEALGELPVPVWLEVKTLKGKLRASQLKWRRDALNAGLRVEVARSLDEALAVLT